MIKMKVRYFLLINYYLLYYLLLFILEIYCEISIQTINEKFETFDYFSNTNMENPNLNLGKNLFKNLINYII